MDFVIILQAGIASGTVLLFATLGEVFAERSGVLNLGVEGMMLIGAMTGFSITIATGNPWLGVLAAMWLRGVRRSQARFLEPLNAGGDPVETAVAAGLANAIFRATGKRLRTLPLEIQLG